MKPVYTHPNLFFVTNAKNILQHYSIKAIIQHEYLSGAAGDLAPIDTWPELWLVDEADYPRAKTLLDEAFNEQNADDWHCSRCGENNDAAFELCWQCGQDRDPSL